MNFLPPSVVQAIFEKRAPSPEADDFPLMFMSLEHHLNGNVWTTKEKGDLTVMLGDYLSPLNWFRLWTGLLPANVGAVYGRFADFLVEHGYAGTVVREIYNKDNEAVPMIFYKSFNRLTELLSYWVHSSLEGGAGSPWFDIPDFVATIEFNIETTCIHGVSDLEMHKVVQFAHYVYDAAQPYGDVEVDFREALDALNEIDFSIYKISGDSYTRFIKDLKKELAPTLEILEVLMKDCCLHKLPDHPHIGLLVTKYWSIHDQEFRYSLNELGYNVVMACRQV